MFVPIPTFPLPLTNKAVAADEDTSNKVDEAAPEIWREADGVIVPIPILPELDTLRASNLPAVVLDTKNPI